MFRFEFKAYRRRFVPGFSTARESFPTREGILLRVEDSDGRVGFGEAAPIPSFGSESFPVALAYAAGIGDHLRWDEDMRAKLRSCRALNWGIESAIEMIVNEGAAPSLGDPWPICGLVADLSDREAIERRLELHFRCLKFKIGKGALAEELSHLDWVVERTGGGVAIRLDANASLSVREASGWLERCAELPVEFLEQPLPAGQEPEMFRLAQDFPTPLALDESACSVDDLKRWRDAQWPGVYVIKPSLCGSLAGLGAELGEGAADCVFSSSLETLVGARSALVAALTWPGRRRPLGFGVAELFADKNVGLAAGPFLQSDMLPSTDDCQRLWNQI